MTERPSGIWLSLVTLASLAILVTLGVWQIDRLQEKRVLLDRVEAGLAADPVPLPAEIADPAIWDYRRIIVSGRFDHAREFHVNAASVDGTGGYHILTPLVRDGVLPVLVNRGWVPPAAKSADARAEGQVEGTITVEGIARVYRQPGIFTPAPDIAGNVWYHPDVGAMGRAVGLDFAPVVVDADATTVAGGFPIGGQTQVDIPNNHLQYVVTWFGFAVALLVIYVVYMVRRR